MTVFFGLICAGISLFIFISLVVNSLKSRTAKMNRRVRRTTPTIDKADITRLKSDEDNEIACSKFDDIVDLKNEQEPIIPTNNYFEDTNSLDISEDHDVSAASKDDVSDEIHQGIFHEEQGENEEREDLKDKTLIEHVGKVSANHPDSVHESNITENCENSSSKVYFSEDLITLFVIAKPEQSFEGYELYQTLIDEGLIFGDMEIFHYFVSEDQAKTKHVFSVAQATEPGTFNLDNFGSKAYQGICLLMNLDVSVECEEIFDLMLEKSYNIARSLNGLVCDQDRKLLSGIDLENYYDKIFSQRVMH